MPSLRNRNAWKFWLSGGAGAALLATIISISIHSPLYAGGDAGDGKTDQKAATNTTESVKAQKLSGEDLYAINCSRCHSERYPKEFTPSQWRTLILHMRVRANLPADQAREILKYMQEESGN